MERSVIIKAFADNPIVLRDLRATMRGTRAFWFQAAYLGLLGILAVTGYAISTQQSLFDNLAGRDYHPQTLSIVDAQRRLQEFYYFIFVTLAGLITLIAPALTATSVSDERQRQSLDLLITTPISAFEMLVGKLISSLAFLSVLLALSLPASALCVLLGGATLGDMFRVYALFALDAVVLASIGLYFSCACKNSLQSVYWTYVAVIGFVAVTFYGGWVFGSNGVLTVLPISVVALLSPFGAIMPGAGQSIPFGPVSIPLALAVIPAAFLAVRLILTAAAYRFGTFGAESGRSLRKQVLAATGIGMLIWGYSVATKGGMLFSYYSELATEPLFTSDRGPMIVNLMWLFLAGLFTLALPFLPGLFVPVRAEDAPPGDAQAAQMGRDRGVFSPGVMLLPRHSGALPYFYVWLGVAIMSLMTGIFCGAGGFDGVTAQAALLGAVYVAGTGTLMWGLSRVAACWTRAASSARALAFGLIALAYALPALPLSWMQNGAQPDVFLAWLGSPMLYSNNREMIPSAILMSGITALLIGLVAGVVSKPQKA